VGGGVKGVKGVTRYIKIKNNIKYMFYLGEFSSK
jgi:hypothetical protein